MNATMRKDLRKTIGLLEDISPKLDEARAIVEIAAQEARDKDDDGTEYWLARDLRILLDYTKWENFEAVLERAIRTCETVGQSVSDHFQEVFPEVGKNPRRREAGQMLNKQTCPMTCRKVRVKNRL